MSTIYDVAVIGGGPAGYVAAIKAAQLGGKVALIEKEIVGGTCLNKGCIPTKTYLKNVEIIHEIKKSKSRGILIDINSLKIDMTETVKMKNTIVKKLTSGINALLKANNVEVIHGKGIITGNNEITINNEEKINTKKIIIAGGSKVSKIPIPGIESKMVLTSDEILSIDKIPENLTILGGGVIGIEMAFIFKAFGSNITIIELENRILPFMDEDISKEIQKSLKLWGIEIKTGIKLERIEEKKDKLTLFLSDNSNIISDMMLLSIGRSPDTEAIGNLNFEMDGKYIKVSETMETSIKGIYAPGDINGKKMLAHAAFKMGEIAAINAMGKNEKAHLKYTPSIVYSIPEVGSVGLTEKEAGVNHDISIGYYPISANGRALASGETNGFVKVITDKKYGEILGVHIVSTMASEIINEAASLMEMEITADEIAEIIHGHPTISESFMEAVSDSINKSIHLPPKKK